MDAVPEIGFHHRGAEKMGERQTWHTYIPYTDRVDYLGGVMNNLAYLTAVEKLAGIKVPPRAQVIRVMLAELFRIISHLVWYGTFAQDLGPVVAGVLHLQRPRAGLRHHRSDLRSAHASELVPHRRRSAGPATRLGRDVPRFPEIPSAALDEYDREVMRNRIFKARTKGVGAFTTEEAIEWGVTGPMPARLRLRVGLPQEAALFGLRTVRVRHPDRPDGRLFRPRHGARRGNAPEPAHYRTVCE